MEERNLFIVRYNMSVRTAEQHAKGEAFNQLLSMANDVVGISDSITDFQLIWATDEANARAKFNTVMVANIQLMEQKGKVLVFDKNSICITQAIE